MDRIQLGTPDLTQENIQKLGDLFPQVLTEVQDENGQVQRAVDFDALRDLLGDVAEGTRERYQFTWPGKREAKAEARRSIEKTMRPCPEESVNWDTTENLYIEGDNLDALKILKETYAGKVKMIYIDPPYNTGHDFVYDDDFAKTRGEYDAESGEYDAEGGRLVANLESNGRFHSDWCSMMYPRLMLARDLLSSDGVVFISIDDNEVENAKKIAIETFGASNFLAEFPRVTKKGGKSTGTYAKNHDYVLAFCKDLANTNIRGIAHMDEGFKNRDEFYEKRGPYKLNQTLDYNTLQYNVTMDYPLEIEGKVYVPGGDIDLQKQRHAGVHGKHDWVWRWSKQLFEFGYKNGWIVISKTGRIYTKTYANATIEKDSNGSYYIEYAERTKPITTLDFTENQYSNDNSSKELFKIMGSVLFDYAKPTSLVKMLAHTAMADKDAIAMDFFSGSATTAHAIMQLNAEDNGDRKFILIQLPEEVDSKSEAAKAGYTNICEIGKERIRRAGVKVKAEVEESNEQLELGGEPKKAPDIGFRVLKIESSNFDDTFATPADTDQGSLFDLVDNVKTGRTDLDILFEVLPKFQIPYSAKIEELSICGKRCFSVDDGYLLACFDKNVGIDTIEAIAKMQPYYAIMRDASMADDATHANFEELFKTYSPDTVRRVI